MITSKSQCCYPIESRDNLALFITQMGILLFSEQDDLLIHHVCFDLHNYDPLCYSEAKMTLPNSLKHAVAKRQGEFLAGRLAGRAALMNYGHSVETCEIAIGNNRQPIWPNGFEGSISHTLFDYRHGIALCAVRAIRFGIGIDIETCLDADKAHALWPSIISHQECTLLANFPLEFASVVTIAFSIKESLYKALYQRVGRYFGFYDVSITAINAQSITLTLNKSLTSSLSEGREFYGSWKMLQNSVLTAVVNDT